MKKGRWIQLSILIAALILLTVTSLLRKQETPETETRKSAKPVAEPVATSTPSKSQSTNGNEPEVTATENVRLPTNQTASIQQQAVEGERNRIMRRLGENMQNSGMNKMIYDQQRVLMADKYRDLARSLELNEEETAYLMDLVTTRQMVYVNFGMKLMTGTLSPEQQKEEMEKLQQDARPITEEIDYFLNSSEDAEFIRYYDRTEQQRTAVNAFKKSAEISAETGEELISIMYDEMNRHTFSLKRNEDGEPDPSRLSDETISLFASELSALSPKVLERAASVLNAEQLPAFEAAYVEYVNNESMRLQMMKQLMQ